MTMPRPPDSMRRPDERPQAGAARRSERWMLCRAGILNVYQYGNEILEFGGGRLLLRGVNGSGKSTAMNMLLPFLLDADPRRIDAAGEQSGVLKTWMLAGREEPQPVGYLWLELARGGEHLAFGCGIRANRSTERVTTWWFVTSRRPGIDLQLVEGRVPIGADKLRSLVEPGVVFAEDQRAAYRAELRARLYGGSDLESYLHLLRIVRNPRVGDRLDTDLPQYLEDALPHLSEAALEDAAQPLEDLEEHRRSVTELGRTADALLAIQEVYRSYARSELHRICDAALASIAKYEGHGREAQRAQDAQQSAQRRFDAASSKKVECEREIERLSEEIRSIEGSDAYKSGAQLNDVREHVRSLQKEVERAQRDVSAREDAAVRTSNRLESARREARTEQEALRDRLTTLAMLASRCGLTTRPPAAPLPRVSPAATDRPELPTEPLDISAAQRELDALRASAQHRGVDVREVETAVRAAEAAERALRACERAVEQARAAYDHARTACDEARTAFQARLREWREAASAWIERVTQHYAQSDFGSLPAPLELDDPASRVVQGESLAALLHPWIDPAIVRHRQRCADLELELARANESVAELEARVAELSAKQLPDPPAVSWQRRGERLCLAEWIDFMDELDAPLRAGLEAALEASGLLAAEVHGDGALRLSSGQLVLVRAAEELPSSLADLLRVTPPAGIVDPRTVDAVARILRCISTELEDPRTSTAVTTRGEFRIGALRGLHSKVQAEHIGVSARRAALERLRAEASSALAHARAERERIAVRAERARASLADASKLRESIPAEREVFMSFGRREQAEAAVERAARQLDERQRELTAAEQRYASALEAAHSAAARCSLPSTLEELREIGLQLREILDGCKEAQRDLGRAANAIEGWRRCGDDWQRARVDAHQSKLRLEEAYATYGTARTRLETLEQTIGVEYARVVSLLEERSKDLDAARRRQRDAQNEQLEATGEVEAARERCGHAQSERARSHAACVQELSLMRSAVVVPGLVAAAVELPSLEASAATETESTTTAPDPLSFPVVDESPEGLRTLCEVLRTHVPAPSDAQSAEGVRQSLRRRRDTLAGGWDAEDHQPDPSVPLRIDVTGPIAPQIPLAEATRIVRAQLQSMSGLLSAKQHQALRNLLQGLVAREVADKLHAARELIDGMNRRLGAIRTSHGIGVSLRWRQREDLDEELASTVALLAKPPDLRTADEDATLSRSLGRRIDEARREDPDAPYRELIARVLDYRSWHRMGLVLHRRGRSDERLGRRTALSEGEKKIVSYLPLFAAVAAACDALAASAPGAPRFVLLDDAFAKVSEDNHPKLFGLLVELDLDFIATSERLWGTHDTVPELAITEVIRDADLGTIVLEHSRWQARAESAE